MVRKKFSNFWLLWIKIVRVTRPKEHGKRVISLEVPNFLSMWLDIKYPKIKQPATILSIPPSNGTTFDQPLTLTYETKNSGKTVFLTKIKFDFNIENKFVFEGSLSVPDQLPKDIDVLLSVIWKQSPTSFSVTGEWNSLNRNYKITSKYVYRLL